MISTEYKTYELEDVLDLYVIGDGVLQHFYNQDNDEQGDNYLDNLKAIGDMGEAIAENYLNTIHNYVKSVSKDPKNGYDIQADNLMYEVKTTIKKDNAFDVSIHELDIANNNAERYKLIFIKINEKKSIAVGYIISDIFNAFKIDLTSILGAFKNINNDNIELAAINFKISLKDNYFNTLPEIDLTKYYLEYLEEMRKLSETKKLELLLA